MEDSDQRDDQHDRRNPDRQLHVLGEPVGGDGSQGGEGQAESVPHDVAYPVGLDRLVGVVATVQRRDQPGEPGQRDAESGDGKEERFAWHRSFPRSLCASSKVAAGSVSGPAATMGVMSNPKDDLQRYLQAGREALLWKLDGLSEYDVRRPLVPTGTNLLGLVKHLASVELGYFGDCFGRTHGEALPWSEEGAEANADMWATPDQSRNDIISLYHRAWRQSDGTIEALDLDSLGRVPWWPAEHAEVSLHRILIHVATETHRHAGHADIVRELIDGSVGLRPGVENMPEADEAWWPAYRERLERAAGEFT